MKLKMTTPHSQISLLVRTMLAGVTDETLTLNGLPQYKFYSLKSLSSRLVGQDGGSFPHSHSGTQADGGSAIVNMSVLSMS